MSPDAPGDMVFISHADWDHCELARKRGKSDFLRESRREGIWREGGRRRQSMKEKGV